MNNCMISSPRHLHLQISGDLFWGYNIRVKINDVYDHMDHNETIMSQSLIEIIKEDMIKHFDAKGCRDLSKLIKENVFHIHHPIPNDNNLDDFRDRKVFICNHAQCQCNC